MYYYCEITRGNLEHSVINGLMLSAFNAVQGEDAVLITNQTQLRGMLEVAAFSFNEHWSVDVPDVKAGSKLSWARKIFKDTSNLFKVLMRARKYKPTFIYFCSLSPLNIWLLNKVLPFFIKNHPVYVALHGELELVEKKKLKRVERIYKELILKSFIKPAENIKYFIFGAHISEKLSQRGFAKEMFIVVPHPYIFDEYQIQVSSAELRISHLGVAKFQKKSEEFFNLASYVGNEVGRRKKTIFRFIGPVFREILPFRNDLVEYAQNEVFLSRRDFNLLCASSDIAAFFQTDENYGYTSSGSIMDAISFNMIILSFDNAFIRTLKTHCDQGVYIFADVKEMADFIQKLQSASDEEILSMRMSLDLLKPMFGSLAVINQLKAQI